MWGTYDTVERQDSSRMRRLTFTWLVVIIQSVFPDDVLWFDLLCRRPRQVQSAGSRLRHDNTASVTGYPSIVDWSLWVWSQGTCDYLPILWVGGDALRAFVQAAHCHQCVYVCLFKGQPKHACSLTTNIWRPAGVSCCCDNADYPFTQNKNSHTQECTLNPGGIFRPAILRGITIVVNVTQRLQKEGQRLEFQSSAHVDGGSYKQ